MTEKNSLSIGGNSYGPNAVGRHARATQVQHGVTVDGDDQAVVAALRILHALVEQHRAELPQADRVQRDIDTVAEEAGQGEPDAERLRDAMKRILSRVGQVATVLAAATRVHDLIEKVLR